MNTKKNFGYGIFAVMIMLLVCTLSLTGCPEEPEPDDPGTPGLKYELINGDKAYVVSKGTVTDGSVIIPATYKNLPVTEIGSFEDTDITSITIPDSVTYIGTLAFLGCTSLTSITVDAANPNYASEGGILYNKAQTILIQAPGAISGSVTIPDSVTSIGQAAFSGCTGLTSVTIPASVKEIGNIAFRNCTGLTSITIPDSVTYISVDAFASCTGLTSITIPDSVTSINAGAFSTCIGLASITIPDSVTAMGGRVFWNWSSNQTINVPWTSGNKPRGWNSNWDTGCNAQIVYQQ